MKWQFSKGRMFCYLLLAIVAIGLVLPSRLSIPVTGATSKDWNANAFWYEPWGASGVHKGIDIFADKGRTVTAAGSGVVIYTGELARGGKVVLVLGTKWCLQYYAHLDSITTHAGAWLARGQSLGVVGNTGNAAGKPAHLHFSVVTLVPYPWRASSRTQGWKQMFYLDPTVVMH